MQWLDVATMVVIGLMVGVELTVSLFINPVMRKLDAPAQTYALSLFAALLGRAMPFWYGLSFLLLIAETWLRYPQGFAPLLTATLLWAAVIVFTLAVLVPINNRIAALSADAPLETWQPSHTRWDRLHRLRILLLFVSFVLLLCALLH